MAQETVLVTGASMGLGLETALYLADQGFNVYATILDPDEKAGVDRAAEQRNVTLNVVQLDVTDRNSIEHAVSKIVTETGGIFGLVNNAGTGLRGCFEDLTEDEIRQVFDVNVFGTMAVTQQVLPHMRRARRGRIVTITSIGGRIASFGLTGYCATKFAQEGFGEALALEVQPFGIKSIMVEPGIVMTPHWTVNRGTAKKALDPKSPYFPLFKRHESIADRIAERSRTKPVHVAQTVHRALTEREPSLRYVVGFPASLVIPLRRFAPERVFNRLYFGGLLRQITREERPHDDTSNGAVVTRRRSGVRDAVGKFLWAGRVLGPKRLRTLQRARKVGFVDTVRGHYTTRVLSTLFNVGFFDELESRGSIDISSFAASQNLDPAILNALCDYLLGLEIIAKRGEHYVLDEKGQFIVEFVRGALDSAYAYEDVVHQLEPLLKRDVVYGREVNRKTEFAARGSGAGGRLFTFPLVTDLMERKGFRRPLDLACGDAAFLIDLCRKNSNFLGYGIDISPEAIEEGRQRVREAGLSDRIQLFTEDMYEVGRIASELSEVDVITSFYGFQELLAEGRSRVLELLWAYREALPKATFIVCEVPKYDPEELRGGAGGILEYQLFHALTHQRLATRQEWMDLWREAGFGHVEEQYLGFARTVFYVLSW
jgi:NAD(P)-dependent dehydrogenase (short-subunit alcohol dehydrogenase family)/SAM-dependent methyltransferase